MKDNLEKMYKKSPETFFILTEKLRDKIKKGTLDITEEYLDNVINEISSEEKRDNIVKEDFDFPDDITMLILEAEESFEKFEKYFNMEE